jgi:hypothetical protein
MVSIADDVFKAAKDIAEVRHQTVDELINDISRDAFRSTPPKLRPSDGMPMLPVRDTTPVTLEFVNKLREEFGG